MYLSNRRQLLQSGLALGSSLGLSQLSFLRPVHADETKFDSKVVRLDSGIEPLVQLLEQTPRERVLEEFGSRIKHGTSYREVLAALLLAGVRNVEPRPAVGFKFHSVLVVNSAHLASLSSPEEHRWLPIFWALDYFKSAQAQDDRERGWTMSPVNESAVPSASRARQAFLDAMERWDEAAADVAIAALVRSSSANDIYEMLFRLGSRDLRSIGHKSIYVANSYRTLQVIGWQHAEPVLRSLVYAMLNHEGTDPTHGDAATDLPYRRNRELVGKIRQDWLEGKVDQAATTSLISTLRTASADDACNHVVELLNKGIAPQSLWDAIFVTSGELLMRQPAIVALHSVTTTNAVFYAWQTAADDETRRLLLLQNAAFITMFRDQMKSRGNVADRAIEDLKPADTAVDSPVQDVFATLSNNPMEAAKKALHVLQQPGGAKQLIDAARVLVYLKGDDSHDYKFSSAVLEDYEHVSPQWRNLYMASNLFNLRHPGERDSGLLERTRAALKA